MIKTLVRWLPLALGLAFLLGLAYLQRERALAGENDFVQLYTGAKLVGTPKLYSYADNLASIQATLGLTMESVVYTRPPFYAVLLKPLAWLPYLAAYALFSALSLASILWFVFRFHKECESLPLFATLSIPIMTAVCGGQDTPFLLLILGSAILLARRGRDFEAGLVLSLVAIKFHLFLPLPLLLIFKRHWRMLRGAALGVAAMVLISVIFAGPDSLRQYLGVLLDPRINFSATVMPNLHGLVAVLEGGLPLEIALIAVVLGALVWIMRQTHDFEFLLAATLVCGLLTSFHSGASDDIVLLAVFVAVIKTCTAHGVRIAAALILTPVPYFLVMAGAPYSAGLPMALLILLGLLCGSAKRTARTENLVHT